MGTFLSFAFGSRLRMVASVLCWAFLVCAVLPAQGAVRCWAMDGERLAAPCCPEKEHGPSDQTALTDACCERLAPLAALTPGRFDPPDSRNLLPQTFFAVAHDKPFRASFWVMPRPRTYLKPPSQAPPLKGQVILQI